MTRKIERMALAGLIAPIVLAAAGAAAAHPAHFTFSWAAHVPDKTGMDAAQAFVKDDLPAGLPMAEALARAKDAGSRCRAAGGPDEPVLCRYFIAASPDNGALGQDVWTLSLTPDGAGKLAAAAIERSHYGSRGDLPSGPTFEF